MHICFDSDLPEEGLARLAQALEGLWEGDDLSAELLLVSEEEIRELNINQMTPMDALTLLQNWKEKLA